MLKRYLDAGIAFTKMTQERAEAIVRELVGAGEVGADQASNTVQELVDRSRENTERLLETVRDEITAQIGNLGLATRDHVEALRKELAALRGDKARGAGKPGKKASDKKATGAKASARKAADKEPGKKVPAKKAAAKKAAAKKAPAKKSAPDKRS